MMRQLRQPERTEKVMLMISVNDYGYRSSSSADRSEWRIGRWAGVGVLAMTLGALAIGLLNSSLTRSASAVRTSAIPATPSPALRSSAPRLETARRVAMQMASTQPTLALIENRGRTASRVSYDVQGRETTLSFTPQGLTFSFAGSRPTRGVIRKIARDRESITQNRVATVSRRVITLAFVEANPDVVPQWQEPTPETISPVRDPQSLERIERPAALTLRYRDVWPGIDLLYTVTGNRLRSTLLVKPGADPNQIRFAYHGVTAIRRTETGHLAVTTPLGSLAEEEPEAYQESLYLARLAGLRNGVSGETSGVYQERDGQRVPVAVTYTLEPSGDTTVWGIHVETYDPNTLLIIDRVVHYPGSIGGDDTDMGPGLVADRDGTAYATASSSSPIPLAP